MEDMLPSVADSAAQNANLQRTMCARFLRQSEIKKTPLDWGAFLWRALEDSNLRPTGS